MSRGQIENVPPHCCRIPHGWTIMRRPCARLLWAAVFCAWTSASAAGGAPGRVLVEDIFGRRLNRHGLVLVDWDGYMANPAIKFFLIPPTDAALPARAVLTAAEPRLYFH